ncbi:MAG TPA: hypothetical protein VMI75_32765, partial [Polyangiaceae bacterium]|nr:hypothetical protein [Polyangiaceae bacterium]
MKLRWLALASCALAACAPKIQLGDHLTDAAAEGGGSPGDVGDAGASPGMCDGAGSAPVSVVVFNTSLSGSTAPAFAARENVLSGQNSPIKKSGDSVMCLTGVDFGEDIAKIGGGFPYSYWVKTSVSTPFTNPDTQDGSVPPAPTAPPCSAVPQST